MLVLFLSVWRCLKMRERIENDPCILGIEQGFFVCVVVVLLLEEGRKVVMLVCIGR